MALCLCGTECRLPYRRTTASRHTLSLLSLAVTHSLSHAVSASIWALPIRLKDSSFYMVNNLIHSKPILYSPLSKEKSSKVKRNIIVLRSLSQQGELKELNNWRYQDQQRHSQQYVQNNVNFKAGFWQGEKKLKSLNALPAAEVVVSSDKKMMQSFQCRNWDTNSVIKPLTCLQDMLG